jgi:hypothetical protein
LVDHFEQREGQLNACILRVEDHQVTRLVVYGCYKPAVDRGQAEEVFALQGAQMRLDRAKAKANEYIKPWTN